MAGGFLKTVGVISLFLGGVLLLSGLGAAGYGFYDQEQHKDAASGSLTRGEDTDRTERNELLLMGGAVGAGVGLLALLLGIVFVMFGGGRAAGARHREILEASSAHGGSGAADDAVANTAESDPRQSRVRRFAPIIGAVGVLLFGVIVVLTVIGFQSIDGLQATDRDGGTGSLQVIDTESYDQTIPATVTVQGSSTTSESSTHEFSAAEDTDVIETNVTWEPAQTGSESIHFSLEIDIDGTWTEVASDTGDSALVFTVDDDDMEFDFSGASLRFRAFPGDDGVNEAQDYNVAFTFYKR